MNKKRNSYIMYILFFIAALYFALFILVNNMDIIASAGSGVILLIASYFLFDKLHYESYRKKEIEEQIRNEERKLRTEYLSEFEKIQKATYMVLKKNNTFIEAQLKEYAEEISKQSEALNNVKKEISKITEHSKRLGPTVDMINKNIIKLNDIEKSGYQALIKYNKENARQLALNNNENIDKILAEISTVINAINQEISKIGKTDFSVMEEKYENLSSVMIDNTITVSERIESLSDSFEEYKNIIKDSMGKTGEIDVKHMISEAKNEEAVSFDSESSRVEGIELDSKELDSIDLSSMKLDSIDLSINLSSMDLDSMELDTIEDSMDLYSINLDPININSIDLELKGIIEEKSELENLARETEMLASDPVISYEKPVKPDIQKIPGIDLSDPNKKLNPDDITALFASIGADLPSNEKTVIEQTAEPETPIPEPKIVSIPEPEIIPIPDPEIMPIPQPVPIQELVKEKEPLDTKAPGIDLNDPNKKMSNDDIAALLASMGI